MNTEQPDPAIRQQADEIRSVTLTDARALPNLLGRIVPAMLARHGYYTATIANRRIYFELHDDGA